MDKLYLVTVWDYYYGRGGLDNLAGIVTTIEEAMRLVADDQDNQYASVTVLDPTTRDYNEIMWAKRDRSTEGKWVWEQGAREEQTYYG